MSALLLLLALAASTDVPASAPAETRARVSTLSERAYHIGKELRCPVCQGMPVAESPSEMAQAMMRRIQAMIDEGKSDDEIRQYFVARYGEWVLLTPAPEGFNLLVWLLPPAALLFGVGAMLMFVRRHRAAPAQPPGGPPPAPDDPYLAEARRRLEAGDT